MVRPMTLPKMFRSRRISIRIAAVYLLVGLVWIPVTDLLLVFWIRDPILLTFIQTFKGWVFVLASAMLLYGLIQQALAALWAKYTELQAVLEGTTDAVFIKDLQGRYQLINTAGVRVLGKPAAAIIGQNDTVLFSPETARRLQQQDRQIMTVEGTMTFENMTTTVAGVTCIYSTTKAPYRDVQGRINGVIGIARDITEYKRLEQALRDSEARYRMLVENAPVCIHEIDRDGRLLVINPAGLRMLGVKNTEQDTIDLMFLDTVAPENRDRIAGLLNLAYRGQVVEFEFTSRMGGKMRVFAACMVPIKNKTGAVVKLVGCKQDITRHKRAEAVLQQARDELEQRVQERTAELHAANACLKAEIVTRQVAEQALRENEERFRQLTEHIREVFWLWDVAARRLLYVSPAYEAIWGRSCQMLLAQPNDWLEGVHPEERARVKNAHIHQTAVGKKFTETYRVLRPDGTQRWICDRGFPIRDAAGRVYRIAGLAEDITGRKQAELELGARARQQSAVAKLGQRALTGSSLNFLLNSAVAMLARILKVEYCKVLELLADGQRLQLRAGVGLKAAHIGYAIVDVGLDTQAGYALLCRKPVIVEDLSTETRFRGSPLLLEHGVVSGMSVIIPGRARPFGILGVHTTRRRTFTKHDVHFLQAVAAVLAATIERQRSETQSRQQQAELAHLARLNTASELAAGLAHELNQPLSAITTYAETGLQRLHSNASDPALLGEVLEKIVNQGVRAGEIIRRLRNFLRKTEPRQELIDLNELVRDVVQLISVEAHQRGVDMRLDLAEGLPSVVADPIQIQQVVLNLMRNSLEAFQEVPSKLRELVLRTALINDAAVEVAVTDSGPGLPAEAREKLFHPFFTTKPAGMGLGLVLSKSLVEAHGGRLWATPNPERGVTFHFDLPMRTGDAANATAVGPLHCR